MISIVMVVCVVSEGFGGSKHPSDVLSKGGHGTPRQSSLPGVPIATLKSAAALFERSKSALHIQPRFLRFHLLLSPAPQTDSSSKTHSHPKKLLRPWSLPEKC